MKPLSQPPVSDADLDTLINRGTAEVAREKSPAVRAILEDCLGEWVAEKKRRRKPSRKAIKAALDWQKPT